MMRHYSIWRLSEQEWMEIEEVLLDELDIQSWYGITFLNAIGEETILTLQ